MSEQNPYEPPAGSGPPGAGSDGTEPSSPAHPTSSGSVYESSSYQPQPGEPPPEPAAQPPSGSAAAPLPVAGEPPPGYEHAYPPPGAYAPAAPAKNNTQLFGVLGIVFAVVCCPLLGVLFGWLSMNEAKKTGSDDTLGKVGFWLGIAIMAVWLLGGIIAICAGGIGSWNNTHY